MKPVRTWVLVADGARARVLVNEGPGKGLRPVAGHVFEGEHGATHDLVTDRQGRSFSSVGHGRSAIEARSDPHRDLKVKFALSLVAMLSEGLSAGSYDRLVLVATPVTLGDLRAHLTDQVRARVAGEVALDLTKVPNEDIGPHLKDVLVV